MIERIKESLKCADTRKVVAHVLVAFGITALGYNSMSPQDLSTWSGVGSLLVGVISNPYLLGMCIWNAYSAISDNKIKED